MNRKEITAELHKFLATHHENVECDTCLNVFDDLRNLVAEICEEEKNIDWEQRRYEIAREAMNGFISAPVVDGAVPNPSFKDIATFSVRLADALIKELKEVKNERIQ